MARSRPSINGTRPLLRDTPGVTHVATAERIYTADEREYISAMAAFQARTGRKFPSWTEALQVARELGYAKPGPA